MYINKKETQRQVPKTQEYTANPLYTDILYGYLQAQCEIEGGEKNKFLPKKLINYSKIGEDLEMTRQTASKKFNNLIKLGLVQEREDGYELITLEKTDAFLISLSMLRKLVSALKERTITCYIYLLNRFFAAGEKEYEFTID